MTATIVALVVAVATVIAYGALADRFEYASVRRRQLDVLAALLAFLCFGGIVYGGVRVRRDAAAKPAPPAPTGVIPAPAGQDAPPGVAVVAVPEPVRAPVELLVVPAPVPADPSVAAVPGEMAEAGGGDAEPEAVATVPPRPLATAWLAATSVPPLATLVPPTPWASPVVTLVSTATLVARAPTATPVSAIATRQAPPGVPPTNTLPPPTVVAPTDPPMPLPTSTPNCGDPSQTRVTMSNLSAAADRSGSDLVIRFRAQVRNDSTFPITLADTSVTAINRVAGAEQYGHTRLPDISVEPGAVISLEGAVNLTKLPPPFGTTELCVSFALDTCGARADRPVRQCATVRGF